MEELGSIIPKAFHKHVLRGKQHVLEILTPLWPRVVGKFISQSSRPVAFDNGMLTLAVSSPVWATQLQAMADPIRAQINSSLGSPVVKKLRIRREAAQTRTPVLLAPMTEAHPSTPASAPEFGALPGKLLWADDGIKLPPELAEVVERSFVKYFSRSGKKITA